MLRTSVITAATAALALTGAGVAVAAGGFEQSGGQPDAAKVARAVTESCNGKAQRLTKTRTDASPYLWNEGTNKAIGGVSMLVNGPSRGTDLLDLTFTAETRMSSTVDDSDWMRVTIYVDGSPITPSDLALTGPQSGSYQSNAVQACTRIGPGQHSVRVVTRTIDAGNNEAISAWLDDPTLRAVVSR